MSTVAGSGHQVAEAPNTLPRHLTTFIGRDPELRSLRATVRASRLVTLTGTGGSGKTRLATEVARASRELWPDGIWWIGLEATDDVAGAVIAALELPGVGRGVDVVASWLAARRALLLLDNCEHLIAACAQFSQTLLERCPNLSILATSREPLGVPGEVRWPVSSLDDVDAFQLFEARGQLLLPHFKVSALNREPVAAICRRLDRLPLAIEMAAARLDLMSEGELLANLNDRFGVLSSIARTAPARQQTMAATLDWSYRLLTEDEKRLFRSLAVFQGGFTMEAAEAVCSDAPRTVLPLLSGLVQKSMVVAEKLNDGSTRYRLLESHHAFALEQLQAESDAFDSLRRRHHEHFSNQPWTAVESSNFWSAVSWARDHAQDHGLGIAVEIAESEFSDQARGRKLLLDLLELSGDNNALRARALNLAGRLASRQGDHVSGRKLADESIALARPLQDPELIAQVLNGAGMVYHSAGKPAVSRRMYDEAMGLLKGSPNRRLAIEIQNQLGFIAVEQGEYAPAVPILEECVSYARSVNDRAATARYLESLANAQLG
ncbi:MAG TPA: tetratricopeptide repeat protein, partial [Candidatus Dormibacteraeota bacterium]